MLYFEIGCSWKLTSLEDGGARESTNTTGMLASLKSPVDLRTWIDALLCPTPDRVLS